MPHWITSDGIYYESDYRINETDIKVKARPGADYHFINGNWVQSMPSHRQEEYAELNTNDPDLGVNKVRLRMEPKHAQCKPLYCHHPHSYQPPPAPVAADSGGKKEGGVILSDSTRVMFGFRELIMVGAFVVTATISWQDTNSRIVKLEDTMSSMDLKIRNLEAEHKNIEKQSRQDIQKLEQTIRDLEQVVFMKNQKK